MPRRRGTIPAHSERALTLLLRIPRNAAPGRHLVAADCTLDSQFLAEACVALIDIT
jgi:hypothetical protein